MKILDAKKRIKRHVVAAITVMTVAGAVLIIATLKSIYMGILDEKNVFPRGHVIASFIYFLYEQTQFAGRLWQWAPTVTPKIPNSPGNFAFVFFVLCVGIGNLVRRSALHLSARVRKTILKVEEKTWERELLDDRQTMVAKPDVLKIDITLNEEDQWYKRPIGMILIAVACGVIGQWLNLQLGLTKL